MNPNNEIQMAPLLWVPGAVILPETTITLKNLSRQQADCLMHASHILIPASSSMGEEKLAKGEALFGVSALGISMSRDGQEQWEVSVLLSERVCIESLEDNNRTACFVSDPVLSNLDELSWKEARQMLVDMVRELLPAIPGGRPYLRRLEACENSTALIARMSSQMPLEEDQVYVLLAANDEKQRLMAFMDMALAMRQALLFSMEINNKFSEQNEQNYRRMALERQLEAIRQELDEEDESKEGYERRIAELEADDKVKKALLEDAKRLERANAQSSESEVLRNYLEFALSLPWKKEPAFSPDLNQAEEILNERHSGLEKIKQRIVEHLAVMKLRNSSKGSALLFVGPPGTGKTSLGKSIAKAMNRPYVRVSLGGIRDESEIRGHRRTYVGAMAGRILQAVKEAGASNPVIVLDEMDKMMQGGFSGDPAAAMLEVLDPEQNSTFTDHYLNLPFDLSDVLFIGTANALDTIPAALLDRMECIELRSYTPSEKLAIAKEHLVGEVLADHGITEEQLSFEEDALKAIIDGYTMEGGCRGLKKQIARIARHQARALLESDAPVRIKAEDLQPILGPAYGSQEKVREENPCGMVCGLAWTAVGGKTLYVETAWMPGTGQMILTGQLGDVMKESVRIALSVLKRGLPMDPEEFAKRDLHIHFPAGATPKDGPSAGITILSALASLITQKPVSSRIAMTGELSLSGQVLPIGGLPEKLSGALRAGIETVLIPKDNVRDLDEVPEEVKNALHIIPVETADEVLEHVLDLCLAPAPMLPLYTPAANMQAKAAGQA